MTERSLVPQPTLLPDLPTEWRPSPDASPQQIAAFTAWIGNQAVQHLIKIGHDKLQGLPADPSERKQAVQFLLRTEPAFYNEVAATMLTLADGTKDTAEASVVAIVDRVNQDSVFSAEGFDTVQQWVAYYSQTKSGGWSRELGRIAALIPWFERLLGESLNPTIFYDAAVLGKMRPVIGEFEAVANDAKMNVQQKGEAFDTLMTLVINAETQKEVRAAFTSTPRVALARGTIRKLSDDSFELTIVANKGRAKSIVNRLKGYVVFERANEDKEAE